MPRLLPYPAFIGLAAVLCLLGACQQPDAESEPMRESDQTVATQVDTVATGRFANKGGQTTSGTYRIERVDDHLQLVLAEDFKTDGGPDLHVVLSPTGATAALGDNAMADDAAMVVDSLTALSGAQQYDLSDDTDLTPFKSVLIHCIRFSHLYGAAPLP